MCANWSGVKSCVQSRFAISNNGFAGQGASLFNDFSVDRWICRGLIKNASIRYPAQIKRAIWLSRRTAIRDGLPGRL